MKIHPFIRSFFKWDMFFVMLASVFTTICAFGAIYSNEHIKYRPVDTKNACLVNAIGFQDALKVHEKLGCKHWSRILVMDVAGKGLHVVSCYEWNNTIFAYTAEMGSVSLTHDSNKKNQPRELAQNLCFYAGSDWKLAEAYYIDEK